MLRVPCGPSARVFNALVHACCLKTQLEPTITFSLCLVSTTLSHALQGSHSCVVRGETACGRRESTAGKKGKVFASIGRFGCHGECAQACRCTEASPPFPDGPRLQCVCTFNILAYHNKRRRLPAVAPLNVCVYKISDRAGDSWSAFEGVDAKLWQIQLDHSARPSCLFDLRGRALI